MCSTHPIQVEFYLADGSGEPGQTPLGMNTVTAADAAAEFKSIVFRPPTAVAMRDTIVAKATMRLFLGSLRGSAAACRHKLDESRL